MSPQAFLGWDHFSVFLFCHNLDTFVECPSALSSVSHDQMEVMYLYFSMQRINVPSLGVSVLIPWIRWCHPGVCTRRLLFPFGILRQCNTLFLFKLLPVDFRSRTINYMQQYTLAFSIYELEFFCRRGLPPFKFYTSKDLCIFILSAGNNPAQSLLIMLPE